MKAIFGYTLAAIGLAGVIIPIFDPEGTLVPFLASLSETLLMVISIALLAVGLFIITKSTKRKKGEKIKIEREVPIYQGKNVIGFRKVKTV